jgi:hypothetical protein
MVMPRFFVDSKSAIKETWEGNLQWIELKHHE